MKQSQALMLASPLEPYLSTDSVTEIMVNSYLDVFIEMEGKVIRTNSQFRSEDELQSLIAQMARDCGREVTAEQPFFDGRLPDGSRVNATVPPMSPHGATLTIRKFNRHIMTIQDLIQRGSLSQKAAHFLKCAVEARFNLVIAGGTSSGKTTFLNVLSAFVPRRERIITIEDTLELNLSQENWIRLEAVYNLARPVVSVRDCLANSLRMRPDRIIVGECRKDEAFEMLQAMNTGHDGSMTTIHANGPRDALARLESLVQYTVQLPIASIRKQISGAVDLVIHLERDPAGRRQVTEIIELTGMEGDVITSHPIFSRDYDFGDPLVGELVPTGLVPKAIPRFSEAGHDFPPGYFSRPRS